MKLSIEEYDKNPTNDIQAGRGINNGEAVVKKVLPKGSSLVKSTLI